ncbi:MAG: alanine--tRNA ligase-related protein [Candidatus Bilamarchaeum sp.]|jgi:misacylated tRNA(Ala) deacylase
MTELICLKDSYAKECQATVTEKNGKDIILDQTVFYPRGGGQPTDFGTINQYRIVNVSKKDGKIIHECEVESDLKVGDKVIARIDWGRRYKLMRMHTAAHILAATAYTELGYQITGNQIEVDQTRFDFSMENFDRAKFDQMVEKCNEKLTQNTDLKVYELPREEALKIPGVVKLANALPPSIAILRIVEIPGIDLQADGGTHVKNVLEVGKIKISRLDNKGAKNKRIYFELL